MKPDFRLILPLLLAGCQGAPLPDTSVAVVQALGTSYFQATPRVTATLPADGLARTQVNLTLVDGAAPHLSLLNLPGSTWTRAQFSLFSPTVNGTFSASTNLQTVSTFDTTKPGHALGTANFPPLRPASDYAAQIFLQSAAGGTLAGSQAQTVSLGAGVNNLDFLVTVNGQELTYQLTGSSNNNAMTGNNLVRGDVVTLATGVAASQPGVAKLVLELSGAAYGNTATTLAVLTDPTTWSSFAWNTAVPYTLPVGYTGAAGYAPAQLQAGTGLTATAGTLTIRALDAHDTAVGTATLTLGVYGTPQVQATLR